MAHYYAVSQTEMEDLLFPLGFTRLYIGGTHELVYGKIVEIGGHVMTLRVLSGINEGTGESRACGNDAIRVQLFWRYQNEPIPVGKPIICHRVGGWASNLSRAIERWQESWKESCPRCGAPLVLRKGKHGEFWGCVTWSETRCDGKPKQMRKEFILSGNTFPYRQEIGGAGGRWDKEKKV